MQSRSEVLIASLGSKLGLKTGLTLDQPPVQTLTQSKLEALAGDSDFIKRRQSAALALRAESTNEIQDPPPSTPRSLKTRAVYYLSKREHSRAELAKKLSSPTYKARQKAFVHRTELPPAPSAEVVESVLNDLQSHDFLNDERFALSLARKNASKHGSARVMSSLGQHQLAASTTQAIAAQLKVTELPRCYEVWSKRFAHINRSDMAYADSQAALGKQGRFLIQRGFNSDAVNRVLKGWTPHTERS
jgi:regulatory protein